MPNTLTAILADQLLSQPIFQQQTKEDFQQNRFYTVFLSVPVKCLSIKDSAENTKFANYTIDLLICRGNEAVQAIIFDAEYCNKDTLFSTYLKAIPHLFLDSSKLTEELTQDICGKMEKLLRNDRNAPQHTDCFLYFILVNSVLSRMDDPSIAAQTGKNLYPYLRKKHLLYSNGAVTSYGSACGLFRNRLKRTQTAYVTAMNTQRELKRAFLWNNNEPVDDSLEQRLWRLRQGLPAGNGSAQQAVSAVKQLRDTPLEQFFANDRDELRRLRNRLDCIQQTLQNAPGAPVDKIRTYGDVISAVKKLRDYTDICPRVDVTALSGACQAVLTCLSVPLLHPPACHAPEDSSGRTGLQARLRQIQPQQSYLPICTMPLSHYFYGAACLEQSEYPLWLYRSLIRYYLTFSKIPEQNWTLAAALQYADSLRQSEDENDKADYLPFLYNLLSESLCGAAGFSD